MHLTNQVLSKSVRLITLSSSFTHADVNVVLAGWLGLGWVIANTRPGGGRRAQAAGLDAGDRQFVQAAVSLWLRCGQARAERRCVDPVRHVWGVAEDRGAWRRDSHERRACI